MKVHCLKKEEKEEKELKYTRQPKVPQMFCGIFDCWVAYVEYEIWTSSGW